MAHYSNIPMVRLIIPVITGVLLFSITGYYLNIWVIVSTGTLLIGISVLIALRYQDKYHLRWIFGVNVMLMLLLASYLLAQYRFQIQHPDHFSHYIQKDKLLRLKIIEPVSEKANSYQIVARVTHLVGDQQLRRVKGKIMLYLEKDSLAQSLQYGNILFIENNYQEIAPPKNPDAFNYKRFLANQNIFHQGYRRSGQWQRTSDNEGNPVIKKAHQLREIALHTLESHHISGKEFSVVSALLLGYREYLDEDLQREFAGAGAMHILCVSGLHVGIIFLALKIILSFLHRFPKGYYLKTILIILLIWFYAAITGFSPSVMRASTMFSFVAIGQSFNRSTNIYNTLAASALILIIIDPLIINRIGFQLSYLAVISIVALQPIFYRQLYFSNIILNKAWGILTVSLAAQLATGPLALYYFNQFPNYFLLTNLLVIPLAGLIINTGLFFFIVSPFNILSSVLGKLLSWLVYALHSSVRFVEGLPLSTTQNVYITFPETILILLILTTISIFFINYARNMLLVCLTMTLLLIASVAHRTIQNSSQSKIVVYHVPNATAMDIIDGKSCYFIGCDQALQNPEIINFNLREHRIKSGIAGNATQNINLLKTDNKLIYSSLMISGRFMQFQNQTMKLLDNNTVISEDLQLLDTLDLIILRKNNKHTLESILQTYPSRTVVIDSSNSYWKAKNWLDECDSLQLNCWSVRHHGAYILAAN